MNKPHLLVRLSLCLVLLTTSMLPLAAQLDLSVNRADAIYNVGETAFFQAQATYNGTATYEIIYDNQAPVIESGTINLTANQTTAIPFRLDEPGLVICRVNLNNAIREASAAFAPLEISPLEEEPGDFDSFWNNQKNLKNSLPMDPEMSYDSETSNQITYKFSLSNIEGRRIYGYVSVPKGAGPFPASITMPPYGTSKAVVGADTESAEKGGMIAVSLSIHNRPVDQDDPNAYNPDDNTDKDKFYYRYGLIGAMHVIDYLETRPDFDGNVCAMGVSQGGGLSILLAGIDDRVSLLINSNPTMGQHVGYKYDRASGFPAYLSIIDDQNQGNTGIFNAAVNATKYYDAMFHARRFKGASFSLTGFRDLVVPSATALVSHNQLPGSKVLMISRDGGHDHPNEYWNGRFEFMRRHFAGSNNPPFEFGSTNKGFFGNAGDDQTVGTSANLNGQIFYDNDQLTNLNVSWTKVSGPGNVNFSNANGYNTTANFGSNGTYVLRFTGRDDRKLNNEGKIYYISDDVTVNVTGGSNPTFTLDVSCPSNQTVQIPAGQSQTSVSWSDPSATSNCSGGANYFQLAGPQNGSSFAQGTYTITYRASDSCGNQEDCSFTVTVNQETVDNSNININCPSDIIIDAPAGDNAVTVSWAAPTATTTCTTGSTGGGDCSSTFKTGYSYMGTFDNSQFYLSSSNENWSDAKTMAENEGGRLAIINSQEENDFIQSNINNEIVFIGLSDNDQEGNYRWVDGSSPSYTNYVGDLNNNGDDDFFTLFPWNGEWGLNNQFVTKRYVLEVPCSNGGGGGNGLTVAQTSGGNNGSNFSVGTTTVTYSATDACGNSETCSFNVTVNATTSSLSINCPSDRNVQIPAGQGSTSISWNPATASSNCSGTTNVTQVSGNGNGNQFSPGNYTITYQASDNCGNQETCSFTINVTNTPTDLSINCPADRVFQIPAGQTQIQVNWDQPTANTSCPNGPAVNQISGPTNFSNLGAGTYTITYEATDNCGNREICAFDVTVNQTTTNLSINCPSDVVIDIPAGQSNVVLNWSDPTTSTNCPDGASLNQIGGSPKFNVVGEGNYIVTYEATDNCGNAETCTFNVTVNLTSTNLTINCPNNQSIEIPSGQSTIALNWDDPTASSTCGNTSINQIGGNGKFSNVGAGIYNISFEATDNCGNRETCSFTITVEEGMSTNNGDITIDCPNNITQNIAANESSATVFWTDPTASTTCTTGGGGNSCSGNTFISGYSYLGEFEGSRYYKSDAPFNWDLATTAAANEGGFITKISSAEENEFIRSTIGSDLCIIGLSDEDQEGTWKYADGSTPSYLNFPNNINNNPSDDYAVINFWNGEWELTTDFIYKKYVLEIPCNGGGGSNPSSVDLNQIAGPANGSNFGVGSTTVTYQAMDDCGNSTTCSFTVTINQDAPINNDGPPTAVVSVASTEVSEDFLVTITFNEPVTSLSGYDLSISNANWYNFTESNGTNFTVMLDPINDGMVMVSVPSNVAYDSDINGNLASNTINVNYQSGNGSTGGGDNPPPITSSSCLIQPFAVSIEDGGTVGGNVSNIINSNGLDAQGNLSAQHGGGSLYNGVWLNDGTAATLRFDLGQTQMIDGIALWNYSYHTWLVLKRRGVKDFQISTSTDGVNFSSTTFHTATQTTARGEKEVAQIFNFAQRSARYVRMRIFNALDDSFYVGLGEVRFLNNCANTSTSTFRVAPTISNNLPSLTSDDLAIEVDLFPNPTAQTFFLSLNKHALSTAHIQIFNEIGALVKDQHIDRIDAAPIEVDLVNQSEGLYFVRILLDGEIPITKRVIKVR